MNADLEISELAENDISEIMIYYEHISDGLGYRFIDLFEKALKEVLASPEAYGSDGLSMNIRRKFIKRFPYNIYYRYFPNKNLVRISAVIHSKRSNQYKMGRI